MVRQAAGDVKHKATLCARRFGGSVANAMGQATDFASAVGERVRHGRSRSGRTQDQVASAARYLGLPWSQQTVAQIERGTRAVSLPEFLLLPTVIGTGRAADYLPETGRIAVSPGFAVDAEVLRGLWRGQPRTIGESEDVDPRSIQLVPDQVERKAAARLGQTPFAAMEIARFLYDVRLAEERDRRVRSRVARGSAAATTRAVRGHVTRELLEEVRRYLSEPNLRTEFRAALERPREERLALLAGGRLDRSDSSTP